MNPVGTDMGHNVLNTLALIWGTQPPIIGRAWHIIHALPLFRSELILTFFAFFHFDITSRPDL